MTFLPEPTAQLKQNWSGEFIDIELEQRFQDYVRATRVSQIHYVTMMVISIILFLIIPEYFRHGGEDVFVWLATARISLAVIMLLTLLAIRRYYEYSDEFAFFAQIFVPVGLTVFDFLKGGEAIYIGNMMLTILVMYIFVPNRLVYSIAAGILAAILTAFSLAVLHVYPVQTVIQMCIMLVITNIFGYVAMHRFNFVRRREYISYMTERQGREQLRAEIEKRMATEDGLRLALSDSDRDSQQKSGALDDLSHELRTPLNAIIGYSESIHREIFGPLKNEQYKEYASIIHDSGIHLLGLITNMLDHSKAESGTVKLEETIVDVEKLVNGVLPMVGSLAREANVVVTATSLSAVPLIRVDEQKVRQILLNLMSNAIKFTPAGGKVELIVGIPEDQSVMLAVKDTGVGIPEADIDKIFKPFEQSMAHGVRGEAGTGLGLSLSRRLAELHGGRISVESKVNEGSVFALILPPERNLSTDDAEQ
jgi:signal transduction histidine kinase